MQDDRYIATADLGSGKIAVSVARMQGDNVDVVYYKETPSDGIHFGSIYNPTKASNTLRAALHEAEEELNIKILQVVIGLPRSGMHQETARARFDRSDPDSCVSQEEIDTLKDMAINSYGLEDEENEEIYGAVAQSFSADNDLINASEQDIVGTTAESLEGNFKIFVGKKRALVHIDKMLNLAGVACARKYFLPTCTARAILSEEEKENGVALIEMGAGVTSLTIYRGGILRHYSSIPFGGDNITKDIQYECGFKFSLAENIKLAFGACLPEKLQSMSDKVLQINDDDNGTYDKLPVKYLSEIVTSRTREIIEAILYLIQESGYADKLRNGIVLTGGCANMVNIGNMIREMSGYTVRTGYPRIRRFASTECPGIGETGAAASVGMLMIARNDGYLNCIQDIPEEPQPQVQEPVAEPEPEPEPARPEVTAGNVSAARQSRADEQGGEVEGQPDSGTNDLRGFLTSLFGDSEIITPTPAKGERRNTRVRKTDTRQNKDLKPKNITWIQRRVEKIGGAIEGAFNDSGLGNLFDSME